MNPWKNRVSLPVPLTLVLAPNQQKMRVPLAFEHHDIRLDNRGCRRVAVGKAICNRIPTTVTCFQRREVKFDDV